MNIRNLLPGLALAALIAGVSKVVAALPVVQAHGFSPLTIAIVLGLLIGNTLYPRVAGHAGAGIGYSQIGRASCRERV